MKHNITDENLYMQRIFSFTFITLLIIPRIQNDLTMKHEWSSIKILNTIAIKLLQQRPKFDNCYKRDT